MTEARLLRVTSLIVRHTVEYDRQRRLRETNEQKDHRNIHKYKYDLITAKSMRVISSPEVKLIRARLLSVQRLTSSHVSQKPLYYIEKSNILLN